MIDSVPETNEEKLKKLTQEVGQAFFDYGRTKYEIEIKEKSLSDISIRIHNLNKRALELQSAIDKENKKAAMELKLAPPPAANAPSPEVQQ